MDPHNAEAHELISRIGPAQEKKRLADYHYANDDFPNAIHLISQVLEVSPWAAELYELRAQMHLDNHDALAAVTDYRHATKLQSDDTAGYYKLASLLYQLGHASDALKSIRECLKLDPEHKDCFPFYKNVKKVEKLLNDAETALEEKRYDECVQSAEKVLKTEKNVQMIVYEAKRLLCACNSKDERTDEAIKWCNEALDVKQDANVYCDRAEAYIQSELYDDAIRDYRSALDIESQNERAKSGLQRAEKLQKQSERRDYYKILDVKRTASKREIIKAYRKMAQKWHPDNYQNDEKMKKIAEKKFIDIAAAKEVLTDEEKRRQFDNGEDPLDPESGKGGMPPNFHQHFQGFHGSPFQFKFHFN